MQLRTLVVRLSGVRYLRCLFRFRQTLGTLLVCLPDNDSSTRFLRLIAGCGTLFIKELTPALVHYFLGYVVLFLNPFVYITLCSTSYCKGPTIYVNLNRFPLLVKPWYFQTRRAKTSNNKSF